MICRAPQSSDEWNQYYDLRYRILRQPLGQPLGSEKNEGDQSGLHLALFANDRIVAIARLDVASEKVYQVRFVAVDYNQQGKGYGKEIMIVAEKKATELGGVKMILQARENAVDFYSSLGYKLKEKTHLLFGQVQHYLMEKEI